MAVWKFVPTAGTAGYPFRRARDEACPDADHGGRSDLHEMRFTAVVQALLQAGASSVLDLGCGNGALLARLCRYASFTRLAGMDRSMEALGSAERLLGDEAARRPGRLMLHHGSFDDPEPRFAGYDAVLLVETIEHVDARRLSAVEHAVFASYRPATVLITTPNREYNALYGMPEHALRHPDHRFEWTRAKFRHWARRAATRNGYAVSFSGIGEPDLLRGSPTQMALFGRGT
jgi:small RNA 2'-O-methyltransferase